MHLKPQDVEYVDAVTGMVILMDVEKQLMVNVGMDADLQADWDNAVFRDNFRNVWPALDGHYLLLQKVSIEDNLYRYQAPIKLNGERVMLEMVYDFADERYTVLGTRSFLPDGTPDKLLRLLKPGDEVTTLLRAKYINRKMPITEVEMDTFTLSATSGVKDEDFGDGDYAFLFVMQDVQGHWASSSMACISVKDGKMSKKTVEDFFHDYFAAP